MRKDNEIEFKFLPERPLSNSNSTLFGHGEIVTTLKRIIKNSPKNNSLTVGLFGDWGSGKSTIVESLQRELSEARRPTPVVIFDVWKHEGDALRRSFLTKLVGYLDNKKLLKEDYVLDNRLKSSITDSKVSSKSNLNFNWKKIFKRTLDFFKEYLLPPLIDLLGIIFLTWSFLNLEYQEYSNVFKDFFIDFLSSVKPYLIWVFSFLGSSALVILIIEKFFDLSTVTSNDVINTNYEKFEDPYEFEGEFRKILNNLNSQKIVIVFDNLDRVRGDKAINIISTIKTFLEPVDKEVLDKEVIFIIPCDDKVIKEHLENELGYVTGNSSEEYLRKFINTSIRIPSFNTTELEGYAWDCLNKTKLEHLKDRRISSLITQVFSDNPRQIVQFINTLITNYLVLWEREKNGNLGTDDFLSKNTPQLAKYLLLEHKYSSVMNIYRQNYLYDLNYNNRSEEIRKKFNESHLDDFDLFLKHTENIPVDNLEIFFKLRITEHEKELKNSSKLIKILETKNVKFIYNNDASESEEVKEYRDFISTMNLDEKNKEFNKIIHDKLREKRLINYDFNYFLNNVLYLARYCSIKLTDEVFEVISGSFNERGSIDYLELISPDILSQEFIEKCDKHYKKTLQIIVNTWVFIAGDQLSTDKSKHISKENFRELMTSLINYSATVNKNDYSNVRDVFNQKIIDDFDSEVLNLAAENKKAQPIFFSEDGIIKIIGLITFEDLKNESDKIKVYEKIDSNLINQKCYLQFVEKLNELFENFIKNTSLFQTSASTSLIKFSKNSITKYKASSVNLNETNLNNTFGRHLNIFSQLNSVNWSVKKEMILYFESLVELNTPIKQDIQNFITEFLQKADVKDLEITLRELEDSEKLLDKSKDDAHVNQRLRTDEHFFRVIYEFSRESVKLNLLKKVISNRQYSYFWNFLEKLDYEIPNKKQVADAILNETSKAPSNQISHEHQKKFYSILEKLNINQKEFNSDNYLIQLNTLLASNNPEHFKVGLDFLISSVYFQEETKHEKLTEILKVSFKNIGSFKWKIIEVIQTSKDSLDSSIYDNLVLENEKDIIKAIIAQREPDLIKEILTVLSESIKIKLIASVIDSIIAEINPNRSQNPLNFLEIFKIIFNELKSKVIYFGVKEKLMALMQILLEPIRDPRLHTFIAENLSLIKSHSRSIPSELQLKIDELFFDSTPTTDLKVKFENYLSKHAKNDKLIITEATYGAEGKFVDITDKLNSLIKASTLEVKITNDLVDGDDPAEGIRKVVSIKYRFMNEAKEIQVPENHILKLP